jgi:peptidoglycan L-alanyl-D-glutamate endopeptidase CwlK
MSDSGFKFSSRSYDRMRGVDPRLIAIAALALKRSEIDFVVTEGLRTTERQRQLVAAGASRTMKSKHIVGRAIDVAAYHCGEVRWDWPLYEKIAAAMLSAAADLNVSITWGGHWTSLKDGPHFELKD